MKITPKFGFGSWLALCAILQIAAAVWAGGWALAATPLTTAIIGQSSGLNPFQAQKQTVYDTSAWFPVSDKVKTGVDTANFKDITAPKDISVPSLKPSLDVYGLELEWVLNDDAKINFTLQDDYAPEAIWNPVVFHHVALNALDWQTGETKVLWEGVKGFSRAGTQNNIIFDHTGLNYEFTGLQLMITEEIQDPRNQFQTLFTPLDGGDVHMWIDGWGASYGVRTAQFQFGNEGPMASDPCVLVFEVEGQEPIEVEIASMEPNADREYYRINYPAAWSGLGFNAYLAAADGYVRADIADYMNEEHGTLR